MKEMKEKKEKSIYEGKNCKPLPNTYKKQSGITLIALVITIVILIILAGIMISYGLGENGVFQKAKEAKIKTEKAVNEEEEDMSQVVNVIDEYANGKGNGENNTPEPADPTWQELNEIAKAIANDSNINASSESATVTINGESKTVTVGETYKVKYGEEEKNVRVLGFKHDDLVDSSVYGGNHTKASISFEFVDFITGTDYKSMNSDSTNEGGWASTNIRTELNGTGSSIGGLGANLSNKSCIKQVKKKYIETYSDASKVPICNDYLWLLSASEIIPESYGLYGYAITSEGKQYKYYQGVTQAYDESSTGRAKKDSESGTAFTWWLRSPCYNSANSFCTVTISGKFNAQGAGNEAGIAPGFSI